MGLTKISGAVQNSMKGDAAMVAAVVVVAAWVTVTAGQETQVVEVKVCWEKIADGWREGGEGDAN